MLSFQRLVCVKLSSCISFCRVPAAYEIDRRSLARSVDNLILPSKPRKPSTSFLKFMNQSLESLRKDYPSASHKDLLSIAAEKWRLSSPEFKQPYIDAYLKEKDKYFYELNAYEASLSEDQKALIDKNRIIIAEKREKRRLKKGMTELGKPKGPATPYGLYFATLKGTKVPGESKLEWANKIAEGWKNLPEIEKQKFYEEYKVLKLQHDKDLELWRKEVVNLRPDDPKHKKAQIKVIADNERKQAKLLRKWQKP